MTFISRLTLPTTHPANGVRGDVHRLRHGGEKRAWRHAVVPIALILALAGAAGLLATPEAAASHAIGTAGPELTRLLRMMAGLKLALVAGAGVIAAWRLRFPASPLRIAGYFASLAAMAAAPGLIWSMAHVVAGAALLHGGLLAFLLLLWRDPGSPAMLAFRRA